MSFYSLSNFFMFQNLRVKWGYVSMLNGNINNYLINLFCIIDILHLALEFKLSWDKAI